MPSRKRREGFCQFKCIAYTIIVVLLLTFSGPSVLAQPVWTQADIGTVALPGSYSLNQGTWTVNGSGSGPGGTGDNECVVTTPVSGNTEITARISGQTVTDASAFAGIVIRQSTVSGAVSAHVGVFPGSGLKFLYRSSTGGATSTVAGPASSLPQFVRLSLNGTSAVASYSADGINWTSLGTSTLAISGNYQIGFAVSSNTSGLSTATFDQQVLLQNIPSTSMSGFAGWFRADAGLTSSGGVVSAWTDQITGRQLSSGNGTLLTAALNGLPAVSFEGGKSFGTLPTGYTSTTAGTTLVVVYAPPNAQSALNPIATFSGSSLFPVNGDSNSIDFRTPTSVGLTQTIMELISQGISTGFQVVAATQDNLNQGSIERNGITTVSGRVGRQVSSSTASINVSYGQVAEVLMFARQLTAGELSGIRSYLYSKYAMQDLPPPVVSPGSSILDPAQAPYTISISTPPTSQVFYTIDGTDPRVSGQLYSNPFTISSTTTVQACAKYGAFFSAISSSYLTFDSTSSVVPRTGLLHWFRGDTGAYVVSPPSSRSLVLKWADLSGHNDLAAGTGFVPVTINGKQGFQLGSTSTGMIQAGYMLMGSENNAFSTGCSVYGVWQSTFSSGSNSPTFSLPNLRTDGGLASDLVVGATSVTAAVPFNTPMLTEAIHDGTNVGTIYLNSVLAAQNSNMAPIPSVSGLSNVGLLPSTGTYATFNVGELLLYNRALTAVERLHLDWYLGQRYGLIVNKLPAPTLVGNTTILASNQTLIPQISDTDPNAEQLRFTTDGTDPTDTSQVYVPGKSVIRPPALLKARAYGTYNTPSDVSSAYIGVDPTTVNVPRTNQMLWLRSDIGVTTSGTQVTSWTDLSKTGNNASPGATPPTLVSGAVDFNGTSNYLSLPSGFGDFSSGCTIFVVANPNTGGTTTAPKRFLDFGNGSTTDSFYLANVSSTQATFNVFNGTTGQAITAAGMVLNKDQLFEVVQNGAGNAKFYLNSDLKTDGSLQNISNVSRATNSIGRMGNNTLFFDGQVKEVIMYNRALSDSERKEVEAYIQQRYGAGFAAGAHGPQPDAPTISVNGGAQTATFVSATPVTVAINGTSRFTKYWTTDPGASPIWLPYTGPIPVSSSCVVRAKVTSPYWRDSAESKTYIVVDSNVQPIRKSNMKLWLMADTGVETSGTTVTQWTDFSGSGNNAFKNGTAAAPTYTIGTNAVTFNAALSQYLSLPAAAAPTASNSIFIVFKPTTLGSGKRLIDFGTGSATTNSFYVSDLLATTQKANYTVFNTLAANVTPNKTLTVGTRYLFESKHDGSAGVANAYLNDPSNPQASVSASVAAPTAVSRTINSIGRSGANTLFFAGDILEIIVYDAAVSETERTLIEAYLTRKYGPFLPTPADVTAVVPQSEVYFSPPSVTISSGAGNVFYTQDGSLPSLSSTKYQAPFKPDTATYGNPLTVKAAIVDTGGNIGQVISSSYFSDAGSWTAVTNNLGTGGTLGLKMWQRADFGTSADPSGKLSTWLSADPVDATIGTVTQTNYAQQPLLLPSDINGKPVLRFVGSSSHNMTFADLTNPSGLDIFMVIKPESVSAADSVLECATSTGAHPIKLLRTATGKDLQFVTESTTLTTTGSKLATGVYQLVEAWVHTDSSNITTSAITINGQLAASGAGGTLVSSSRTNNHIGSNYLGTGGFFTGEIAEVIIYADQVSDEIRGPLTGYLTQKYQLKSQVPMPPAISPSASSSPTQVSLSAPAGTTIYFTTDGSTPSIASTKYSQPIDVFYTQTIKAVSVLNGQSSTVATATYSLDPIKWPAPSQADLSPVNMNVQLPSNLTPP